jgi:antitoxin ParD1/3/4
MNLTLPPDLEEFVQQEVASGEFASREAAITAALQLLRERRDKLEALRREITVGKAELDRGEGIILESQKDVDAFVEEIIARGEQRLANGRQA